MEHIKTRKKERKKEGKKEINKQERKKNKRTKIQRTTQEELEIKARPRSYLLLCVKKPYHFKNSSKTCNSIDLSYVDKIILID